VVGDERILTGQTWVVEGALSSEAIVAGAAQEACQIADTFCLATGTIGEGKAAAEAAVILQRGGVCGIIAPDFSWRFFCVCLNIGLPPLVVWEPGAIRLGDRLRVDLYGRVVKNLSAGTRYPIRNLSDLYVEILTCDGMVGYVHALQARYLPTPAEE
jgi:3-isopropylmalate dehydratase small subunit